MNVQVVVKISFYNIVYVIPDGLSFWFDMLRTQFRFCLRFEDGFLNLNADGSNDGAANIAGFKIFIEKLPDGFHDSLAESSLVCPAGSSMLSVDKGIIFFAIRARAVAERALEVALFNVNNGVKNRTVAIDVAFE